jgi:hypothetical protein
VPLSLRAAIESTEDAVPSDRISPRRGWEASASLRPDIQSGRSAVLSARTASHSLWIGKERGHDSTRSLSVAFLSESDEASRFSSAIESE